MSWLKMWLSHSIYTDQANCWCQRPHQALKWSQQQFFGFDRVPEMPWALSVLKGKAFRCSEEDSRWYLVINIGKSVTSAMAKHHAENRFQCPKCRTEQCKACKTVPYHLGFTCSEYQEHKLKKYIILWFRKCRYCHNVLPKGYMSETGIKTFDDICDSDECTSLTKEACSKMLACGHPCYGYIR